MRKIIFSLVVASFLVGGFGVLANHDSSSSAGITPDSPFYFFKTLKENIQTFLIFGQENKAKQFLHLADVRLAEYQNMQEKGKTELTQKTLDKYEKQLNRAISKVEELKNKGKDIKNISEELSITTAKHIKVLEGNLQKVPESAKKGIERALENVQKIKPVGSEFSCETDDDCACGANKTTGDCFYGNKDYVDTIKQCPDFCSGITGKLKIKCINRKCEQADISKDETAEWTTYHFDIKKLKEITGITQEARQDMEKKIVDRKLENGSFEIKYPQGWSATTWPLHGALIPEGLFIAEETLSRGCSLQMSFYGNPEKEKYYFPVSLENNQSDPGKCNKIFNQMLSTFRFLE